MSGLHGHGKRQIPFDIDTSVVSPCIHNARTLALLKPGP